MAADWSLPPERRIMKTIGRVRLLCWKCLACGVIDKFEVVVSRDNEIAAIEKYRAMGYEVR